MLILFGECIQHKSSQEIAQHMTFWSNSNLLFYHFCFCTLEKDIILIRWLQGLLVLLHQLLPVFPVTIQKLSGFWLQPDISQTDAKVILILSSIRVHFLKCQTITLKHSLDPTFCSSSALLATVQTINLNFEGM